MLDIGDVDALALTFVMRGDALTIVVDLDYILIVTQLYVFADILIGHAVIGFIIAQEYMTYLLHFATFVVANHIRLKRKYLQLIFFYLQKLLPSCGVSILKSIIIVLIQEPGGWLH